VLGECLQQSARVACRRRDGLRNRDGRRLGKGPHLPQLRLEVLEPSFELVDAIVEVGAHHVTPASSEEPLTRDQHRTR
jgi:hypothetical protein